jgi:predicted DNA-binding protein (MmcQ/YjbR family)
MYSDDDPFLAELRQICLRLPEVVEIETWGRPSFRAGKIFTLFGSGEDHPQALIFKPDPAERAALIANTRFFKPPYWGPSGWLGLDLSATPADWTEVAELVESSYRLVALKRMVEMLDSSR